MKCRYCFAAFSNVKNECSALDTFLLLKKLRQAKLMKVNFVGGEPLLVKELKSYIKYAKKLGFYTSIVTNGSLLTEELLEETKDYLDQIGLSIDSLCKTTNQKIGRVVKAKGFCTKSYSQIISLINQYGIDLKINTVVSALNKDENIADFINNFKISRWKVFQVLMVQGENSENFSDFKITESDFKMFCDRESKNLIEDYKNILIPETEDLIRGSYLMINPEGKFFDNTKGFYTESNKIIDVGVFKALNEISYDYGKFKSRNGDYYINSNLKLAI
jgi:radical S-adenosyl methionine domain-containing protein 2